MDEEKKTIEMTNIDEGSESSSATEDDAISVAADTAVADANDTATDIIPARKNWTGFVSLIVLIAGFLIGFVVPIIGFIFYILGAFIALIFAIISFATFRKGGVPGLTYGVLICSILLLGWGIFQAWLFPTMLMTVVDFVTNMPAMW